MSTFTRYAFKLRGKEVYSAVISNDNLIVQARSLTKILSKLAKEHDVSTEDIYWMTVDSSVKIDEEAMGQLMSKMRPAKMFVTDDIGVMLEVTERNVQTLISNSTSCAESRSDFLATNESGEPFYVKKENVLKLLDGLMHIMRDINRWKAEDSQ